MESYNIKSLENEIVSIGNLLKQNKKNKNWTKIVDVLKNTTSGDYKVDKLLKFALQKFIPKIPYFSEEVIHKIQDRPNEYWLADPIDGTSSWLNGFDGYVIQASYILNNQPLFSFIYWPEKNKFYHCSKNKGIFLNGKEIHINKNDNKVIIIADNYPKPRGFIKQLVKEFPNIKYLEMGSLGLKSLLVATGECDLFIKTTKYRDWDVIPAKVFLNEIKYKMLYLNGNTLNFEKQIVYDQGLLVYNPFKIDKKIINYIKKMEKNREISS